MPGFEQVVHALDEEKTVQEGTQAEKVEKSGKKDTEELNRKEAQLFAQRAKLEEFVAAHKGELSNKGKIQELMKDFLQDMDNGLDYAKTELQQEDKTDELMALNKDYGSALQSFEALLTRTNTEFANVESETRKSYLSLKSEILKEHNLEVAAKSSEQGNESLEQTNLDYLQKLDLTDTEAISDIFESSESRVYYDALFAVIEDTQDQYGQYSQKASDIIQRYAQGELSKVTDEKDPLHGAIPILSTVKTVLDKKTGKKKFVCDILTKNKETKVLDIYYAEDQKEEQTNMEKEKDVFDRVEDMAKTKTPEQIAKELDTANKEKKGDARENLSGKGSASPFGMFNVLRGKFALIAEKLEPYYRTLFPGEYKQLFKDKNLDGFKNLKHRLYYLSLTEKNEKDDFLFASFERRSELIAEKDPTRKALITQEIRTEREEHEKTEAEVKAKEEAKKLAEAKQNTESKEKESTSKTLAVNLDNNLATPDSSVEWNYTKDDGLKLNILGREMTVAPEQIEEGKATVSFVYFNGDEWIKTTFSLDATDPAAVKLSSETAKIKNNDVEAADILNQKEGSYAYTMTDLFRNKVLFEKARKMLSPTETTENFDDGKATAFTEQMKQYFADLKATIPDDAKERLRNLKTADGQSTEGADWSTINFLANSTVIEAGAEGQFKLTVEKGASTEKTIIIPHDLFAGTSLVKYEGKAQVKEKEETVAENASDEAIQQEAELVETDNEGLTKFSFEDKELQNGQITKAEVNDDKTNVTLNIKGQDEPVEVSLEPAGDGVKSYSGNINLGGKNLNVTYILTEKDDKTTAKLSYTFGEKNSEKKES